MPHKHSHLPGRTSRTRSYKRQRRRLALLTTTTLTSSTEALRDLWSRVDETPSLSSTPLFTDGSADFGKCFPLPEHLIDPFQHGFTEPLLASLAHLPAVSSLASTLSSISGHPSSQQQVLLEQSAKVAADSVRDHLEDFFHITKDPNDISDLHSRLIDALLLYSDDPDRVFIHSVTTEGTPVGLDPSYPIPSSNGLFPPSSSDKYQGWDDNDDIPYVGDNLVANYSSVDLQLPLVESMYKVELDKGWMEPLPPGDPFWQVKVAIIAKKRR